MTTLTPRLMSGSEAAAYCGITLATLSKWVTQGRLPPPLPGSRRWDRKALDLALDKLSGIQAPPMVSDGQEITLAEWKVQNEARKSAAKAGNSGERYHWEDEFDAAWAEWLVEHETWKATQQPSKQSSPAEVENARQSLWRVWKDLNGTRLAIEPHSGKK